MIPAIPRFRRPGPQLRRPGLGIRGLQPLKVRGLEALLKRSILVRPALPSSGHARSDLLKIKFKSVCIKRLKIRASTGSVLVCGPRRGYDNFFASLWASNFRLSRARLGFLHRLLCPFPSKLGPSKYALGKFALFRGRLQQSKTTIRKRKFCSSTSFPAPGGLL